MMASDIHHRTEDFRNAYRSCLADLKEVMGTTNDVLMFAASGTGAMDASISNLFSKGDKVIACVAGKFGERWAEIGKAYGLDVIALTVPYGQVVSPAQVEEALAKEPAVKGVFLQASETSTGASHDVQAIAAAVAKTPAILVVDAITGIGTQPLDIHGWGLDVVIGGSQKAFMIPPGLAFLAIGPKAWALADTATLPHYYFNLKKEKKSADGGESSWTPSTALILAMAEALRFIKKTSMAHMIANAQLLAQATRAAAESLGLELFAASSPGSAVTAIKPPAGMDSGVIVKEFRSRFGAIIANGQGTMKGKIFRIAHLGYFDFADLFAVVAALEIILKANGYPVTYGTGVRAVQEVYERAAVLPKPATA
jgi:aspartate aminotransferase-like enzyme